MKWLDQLKGWVKWTLCALVYRWVPRHKPAASPASAGVNLIGYAQAEMGLGEALRNTARALEFAGIPFLVRKLDVPLLNRQNNLSMQAYMADHCHYGINCIAINPDLLYRFPQWLPYAEWGRRYNVGYWFWELENFPKAWRYACHLVDEVWVNTDFVADAVRQVHPKVYKVPFAVEFQAPNAELDRAYFDLPQDPFLFLFSYDFNSSSARKNPQAVIEAFRLAFTDQNESVTLVVKSINGEQNPEALAALKASLSGDPRIIWVDWYLTTEKMRALLNVSDAYVSLHRSEGLGLGLAESMYLGKPVIATNYSGNVEFMNDGNACMVPYRLVPVEPGAYPHYDGQRWAEPDTVAAAQWMQRLAREPGLANQICQRAADYMREHHSNAVMSAAIAERIKDIPNQLQPKAASMQIFLQRAVQALCGLITMLLIASCLSPVDQGWYYSFLGYASLYTLFDLGFSVALVPYFARLLGEGGMQYGGIFEQQAKQKLTGALVGALRWYLKIAALFVLVVFSTGIWFFNQVPEAAPWAEWIVPWSSLIVATAIMLLLMPLLAFIEAAGFMREITRVRLWQIVVGSVGCCWALYQGSPFWASVFVTLSYSLVFCGWLWMCWKPLLAAVCQFCRERHASAMALHGVQWRIAISWACAYLNSQIFALMLMQTSGPVPSGRFALSMAVANMIGVLALSSMAGNVAFAGHEAARMDSNGFLKRFKQDVRFFAALFGAGGFVVLAGCALVQDQPYAERVLPLWQMLLLLVFMFGVYLLNLLSTYMRSFLKEPFFKINLLSTLITLPTAYWTGTHYDSGGVVCVLAGVTVFFVLPLAIALFRRELRVSLAAAL